MATETIFSQPALMPWGGQHEFGDIRLSRIEDKISAMQQQLDRIERLLAEASPQLTK